MAGERIRLEVQERDARGSRESRRLRREGLIPGVLYGRKLEPRSISVPERELRRVLTGPHGLHTILDVAVGDGEKTHASIFKDYQLDRIRNKIVHFDLQEVPLDETINVVVAVELVGESAGVKAGGVLSQVNREVHVEALPLEVPDRFELDVSAMELGDTLRVSDLPEREGVKLLDDPETVLATVTMPTREVEEEPTDEEAAEGAEAAAEEAPEEGSEAPAEPDADAAGSPDTDEG